MVRKCKITESAKADVKEIIAHIARDNPQAARRVRADIKEAFSKLAEHPFMGHVREDITHKSLRFWPVHSYQIIYNPETMPLVIVRVLSGYRDMADLLED